MIATFFGKPDEKLIAAYFGWQTEQLTRAKNRGTRLATVIDSLDGERPPATIRKVLSEHTSVMLEEFDKTIINSFIVARPSRSTFDETRRTHSIPSRERSMA